METEVSVHPTTNAKHRLMKHFSIPQPCNENFNLMTPTERGAFCKKCATNTFDFRYKTPEEVKLILRQHVGQHICGRITSEQDAALNAEFEQWSFRSTKSFQSAFLFTLIAVFGLGLFSCSDQKHEQEIISFQQTAKTIMTQAQDWKAQIPEVKEKPIVLEKLEPLQQIRMPEAIPEELICIIHEDVLAPDFENLEIYEYGYGMGGAMVMSYEFVDYLIETVPVVEEFDEKGIPIPTTYSALAFPNPTTDKSTIEIKLPASGEFQVDLYDMSGKLQRNIHSGEIERGTFRQEIEMTDLPPGMYLVTILSKEYKETVRISKI